MASLTKQQEQKLTSISAILEKHEQELRKLTLTQTNFKYYLKKFAEILDACLSEVSFLIQECLNTLAPSMLINKASTLYSQLYTKVSQITFAAQLDPDEIKAQITTYLNDTNIKEIGKKSQQTFFLPQINPNQSVSQQQDTQQNTFISPSNNQKYLSSLNQMDFSYQIGKGKAQFGGAVFVDTEFYNSNQNQLLDYKQKQNLSYNNSNLLLDDQSPTKKNENSVISLQQYSKSSQINTILEVDPTAFVKKIKYSPNIKTYAHKGTDTKQDYLDMLGSLGAERDQREHEIKMLQMEMENEMAALDEVLQMKKTFDGKQPTEAAVRLRDLAKSMNRSYNDIEKYLMDLVIQQGLQDSHEDADYSKLQTEIKSHVRDVQKSTAMRILRITKDRVTIQSVPIKGTSQQRIVQSTIDIRQFPRTIEGLEQAFNAKQQELDQHLNELKELNIKLDYYEGLLDEKGQFKSSNKYRKQKQTVQKMKDMGVQNNLPDLAIYPLKDEIQQLKQEIERMRNHHNQELKQYAQEMKLQKDPNQKPSTITSLPSKKLEVIITTVLCSDMKAEDKVKTLQDLLHLPKTVKPISQDILENLKKMVKNNIEVESIVGSERVFSYRMQSDDDDIRPSSKQSSQSLLYQQNRDSIKLQNKANSIDISVKSTNKLTSLVSAKTAASNMVKNFKGKSLQDAEQKQIIMEDSDNRQDQSDIIYKGEVTSSQKNITNRPSIKQKNNTGNTSNLSNSSSKQNKQQNSINYDKSHSKKQQSQKKYNQQEDDDISSDRSRFIRQKLESVKQLSAEDAIEGLSPTEKKDALFKKNESGKYLAYKKILKDGSVVYTDKPTDPSQQPEEIDENQEIVIDEERLKQQVIQTIKSIQNKESRQNSIDESNSINKSKYNTYQEQNFQYIQNSYSQQNLQDTDQQNWQNQQNFDAKSNFYNGKNSSLALNLRQIPQDAHNQFNNNINLTLEQKKQIIKEKSRNAEGKLIGYKKVLEDGTVVYTARPQNEGDEPVELSENDDLYYQNEDFERLITETDIRNIAFQNAFIKENIEVSKNERGTQTPLSLLKPILQKFVSKLTLTKDQNDELLKVFNKAEDDFQKQIKQSYIQEQLISGHISQDEAKQLTEEIIEGKDSIEGTDDRNVLNQIKMQQTSLDVKQEIEDSIAEDKKYLFEFKSKKYQDDNINIYPQLDVIDLNNPKGMIAEGTIKKLWDRISKNQFNEQVQELLNKIKSFYNKKPKDNLTYYEFKKFYSKIVAEHKQCGESCIHLSRFFKLVGYQTLFDYKRKEIKPALQKPIPFQNDKK